MIFIYLAVSLICFFAVFKSADVLVSSSAAIASHFGIPPVFIGVVLVGIGTSAPEIFVTVIASFSGHPGIVLGNATGSIAANTGIAMAFIFWLIEGNRHKATGADAEVIQSARFFALNFTFLALGAFVMMFAFAGGISRLSALLLLGLIALYFFLTAKITKKYIIPKIRNGNLTVRFLRFAEALAALIISSKIIVWAVSAFAAELGISEFIIAVTVVALGTSLPEIATSISATRQGELGIAVGELVGSQALNLYFLLGVSALVKPIQIDNSYFVFGWMALLLGELCFLIWMKKIPSRVKAALLFVTYCIYIFMNFRVMA